MYFVINILPIVLFLFLLKFLFNFPQKYVKSMVLHSDFFLEVVGFFLLKKFPSRKKQVLCYFNYKCNCLALYIYILH